MDSISNRLQEQLIRMSTEEQYGPEMCRFFTNYMMYFQNMRMADIRYRGKDEVERGRRRYEGDMSEDEEEEREEEEGDNGGDLTQLSPDFPRANIVDDNEPEVVASDTTAATAGNVQHDENPPRSPTPFDDDVEGEDEYLKEEDDVAPVDTTHSAAEVDSPFPPRRPADLFVFARERRSESLLQLQDVQQTSSITQPMQLLMSEESPLQDYPESPDQYPADPEYPDSLCPEPVGTKPDENPPSVVTQSASAPLEDPAPWEAELDPVPVESKMDSNLDEPDFWSKLPLPPAPPVIDNERGEEVSTKTMETTNKATIDQAEAESRAAATGAAKTPAATAATRQKNAASPMIETIPTVRITASAAYTPARPTQQFYEQPIVQQQQQYYSMPPPTILATPAPVMPSYHGHQPGAAPITAAPMGYQLNPPARTNLPSFFYTPPLVPQRPMYEQGPGQLFPMGAGTAGAAPNPIGLGVNGPPLFGPSRIPHSTQNGGFVEPNRFGPGFVGTITNPFGPGTIRYGNGGPYLHRN